MRENQFFFCDFLALLLRAIVLFIIFGQFRLKRCKIFRLKLKNFQKNNGPYGSRLYGMPITKYYENWKFKGILFLESDFSKIYIQQEQTPKCLVPTMTAAGNHARKISFNIKTHNNLSCLVDQN